MPTATLNARVLAALLASAVSAAPVAAQAGPAQGDAAEKPAEGGDAAPADGEAPAEGSEGAERDPPAVEAPPAEPEPPSDREQAAELFREGTKSYELGQYPEAVEKFEAAFELAPEPALLFNMGQAQWRWFRVDNDIEHLRKSRILFENYDKRMRSEPNYYPDETLAFITALEAQIEAEERKIAEANRAIIQGPSIDDLEELEQRRLRREKNLRTAKALNASGITFIVLGAVAAGVGVGGLIARATYGFVLDESSGNDDPNQPVPVTAAEDERRRNGYSAAGVAAFSGFVAAGVVLPVGIGLKVTGGVLERRELGKTERKRDKDKPSKSGPDKRAPGNAPENVSPAAKGKIKRSPKAQVYAQPGALITVRF